jgi:hypothetical protein
VAQQRRRTLIALLLEPLRAHGTEEAVCRQRDMRSAGRGSGPTLGAQAARYTDAALHAAAAASATFVSRPSVLAARMRSRDRGWPRGRQARISSGACEAQDAASSRAALLLGRRHDRCVGVAIAVAVLTAGMTSVWESAGLC